MFRLWLTNFGWFADTAPSPTLEAAKRAAAALGFEVTIYEGDRIIGAWSPIGGYRTLA